MSYFEIGLMPHTHTNDARNPKPVNPSIHSFIRSFVLMANTRARYINWMYAVHTNSMWECNVYHYISFSSFLNDAKICNFMKQWAICLAHFGKRALCVCLCMLQSKSLVFHSVIVTHSCDRWHKINSSIIGLHASLSRIFCCVCVWICKQKCPNVFCGHQSPYATMHAPKYTFQLSKYKRCNWYRLR